MQKDFQKKVLKNGLTVLFEKRKLPIVTTSVSCKMGAEYENENIKGVSHFIEHLVFKGTKNRNVKQISQEVEKKGGLINAFTSEELTCFWNELPSKHFNLSMDIASDLVLNPLFEPEPLERERKVILEEIKMYHDSPQNYVLLKIKELLYKKPFGMFIAGTHKTMSKMKREDVLKIFKQRYVSNNMILSVIGKADFEDICEVAEKIFPFNKGAFPEILPKKINKELVEKRKGINQAHFVFGFHMPSMMDKNRYSAEIFNAILGKGMSSILFQEIREKKGLAYAVKGELEQSKNYGYESIYIGTLKDKIKQIKQIILKEIKNLKNLSQKQLDEAKEQLYGLNALSSENSSEVMIQLIQEENSGDAENYYNYEENIKSIKLKDVKKLSKLNSYSSIALIPE